MPAAMPRKIPTKSSGETNRNIGKRKTKYACVVDADDSKRPRLEGAGHKPHQDHITAEGRILKLITILCTNSFRCLKHKKTRCKGGSGERTGKTGENHGMAADESQEQKGGHQRGTEKQQQRSLCFIDGHMSSKEFGVGSTIPEILKSGSCSEVS